jgi:hypothetical protein
MIPLSGPIFRNPKIVTNVDIPAKKKVACPILRE